MFVTKGKAWGKSMRNRVVRAVVSGTPWGVKVQTARGVKVLNDLSTRMLKEADRQFEDWATQRCADLGEQTA